MLPSDTAGCRRIPAAPRPRRPSGGRRLRAAPAGAAVGHGDHGEGLQSRLLCGRRHSYADDIIHSYADDISYAEDMADDISYARA